MAKIVRFHRIGGPEVLQLDDLPTPHPKAGEALIRVQAIGLNRAEVLFRTGNYLIQPKLPSLIGYEAAGTVEEVGSEVTHLAPGDRVSSVPSFLMHDYGTYGEVAILPARALVKYPDRLTPAEAASIWMQYLMAFALIEFGRIQPGDYVLITAASSSVGVAAIQLANTIGAIPLATTRAQEKEETLRSIGAKLVLNTRTEHWGEQVRKFTADRGVDLVFDAVAGPDLPKIAQSVRYQGTVLLYGALAREPTPLPLAPVIPSNLTIRGCSLLAMVQDSEKFERAKRWVYNRVNAGDLKPIISKIFPLAEIVEAHRHMESCQQVGKIVVQV